MTGVSPARKAATTPLERTRKKRILFDRHSS
jgi:hypothetical protein